MKKLLVAALFVVLASPAFAAIQNVKVSGSITSYFVDRSNFDLNTGGTDGKFEQRFFYNSTHVLISSDLSDNVSAQVGLANEVVWGDQNSSNSAQGGTTAAYNGDQNVQLELANITLREFLYSPLTLTIGRQSLSYGNDFLIGAAGFTSVGSMANVATDMSRTQNYDGVRAVLDYKPLTIDMVYVKTNSNYIGGLSGGANNFGTYTAGVGSNNDDQDLYGAVANYQLNDPMSTVVEGSFWARTDRGANTGKGGKPATLFVPDLRVSTSPIKDLTLGAEGAVELGNTVTSNSQDVNEENTKAFALQARASYNIPVLEKYKPNVSEVVSYYSGNAGHGGSGTKGYDKNSAWNALYNDQDLGTTIWRALFTPSNLMMSELSFSVAPLEDVTAKVTWTDLMLADTVGTSADLITAGLPDGETGGSETVKDKRGLGNEIDGVITYAYTEDVSFGLNLGILKPGSIFTTHDSKATASEAIASVGVNF